MDASSHEVGPSSPTRCYRRCVSASAVTPSKRAKGAPVPQPADALVLFGATGDLCYKKIYPALYHLVRRGRLASPVIGVARAGWTRDKLIERVRASLSEAVP